MGKQRPRPKRSREELQAIWDHLWYEMEMLFGPAEILSRFKPDPNRTEDRIIQNALVESFSIHARSLLAFLYSETPKPDDVVADDFFSLASVWREKRPPMTAVLEPVHRRVAKEVAHLSYVRSGISEEQRQWPFVQVSVDMALALREFANLLPTDFIKPKVIGESFTRVPGGGPIKIITDVGSKGAGG